MKRFNVSLFNRLVAYIKSKNFVTDEEAKKAARYTMKCSSEVTIENTMEKGGFGLIGLFSFELSEEGHKYWRDIHERTHIPYNKYSGWIFDYLERHCELWSMFSDFSKQFFGNRYAFRGEPLGLFLSDKDKINIFWLLAHVDQETADAMLENFK